MPKKMIIFDIDGTLCDIANLVWEKINYVLTKNNIDEKVDLETVKSAEGLNQADFAKHCMPFLEKEKRENYLTEVDNLKNASISKENVHIYDNVKETIIELSKKYNLAIVSNCGEGYIEKIIEVIDIKNYILDYIPASAYNITKSEAIKEIIKRNNIEKAVYVGDTILDKESCDIINLDFIYAKYGFGKNIEAKYEIENFKELLTKVEEIL